jgi:excisionase family DNA binding protein
MREMERDLLTIPEVAAMAGVSRVAVLYAIRAGRLPGAFRLGRTWAVPRAAAEGYRPRAYRRRPTSSRRVPRDGSG